MKLFITLFLIAIIQTTSIHYHYHFARHNARKMKCLAKRYKVLLEEGERNLNPFGNLCFNSRSDIRFSNCIVSQNDRNAVTGEQRVASEKFLDEFTPICVQEEKDERARRKAEWMAKMGN